MDVAIIGGGPAGTAAGLTLLKRPGVRVAVLERSSYAVPRVGESLTPGARPLLEYLGVWEAFRAQNARESFGSRAAWGDATPRSLDYMFTVHGTGWHLDRVAFDRLLAAAFRERGGELHTETRVLDCARRPEGDWSLQIRRGNRRSVLAARYLIDAGGRRGFLAGRLGIPRVRHDHLIGVAARTTPARERPWEANILVEACEYGWWYSAPLPGGEAVVVLMSDADLVAARDAARPAAWRALLGETTWTAERTAGLSWDGPPRAFPAHSARLRTVAGADWVAVGDAACSHDPLSSTGIPHALGGGVHGALVAADALYAEGRLAEGYQQGLRTAFAQYLRTRWQYYRREERWAQAPFWRRRATELRLDPHAQVVSAAAEPTPTPHLPGRLARSLLACCQLGRPVHRAARAFAAAQPGLPDETIILALQDLAAQGALELRS